MDRQAVQAERCYEENRWTKMKISIIRNIYIYNVYTIEIKVKTVYEYYKTKNSHVSIRIATFITQGF